MTVGIIDSTVVVHLFRKQSVALAWFASLTEPLSITSISWLELVYGAPGKVAQAATKSWLIQFELIYLTPSDQDWAIQQMEAKRLSQGVEINDCLIASVCHRLQVPLYTHNTKDMLKTLPSALVIKPY